MDRDYVRVTADIPASCRKIIKAEADERGMKFSAWLAAIIEQAVKAGSKRPKAAA